MPITALLIISGVTIFLYGCSAAGLVESRDENGSGAPLQTKTGYYSSDDDYQAGIRYFRDGAYGLAQERFQKAVDRTPRDSSAWMGLAVTYDFIRRFDLADRAYDHVVELEGESFALLNNKGYSYLLRGDLATARKHFLHAYRLDPNNRTILNNISLLSESRRHVVRSGVAAAQVR